MTLRMAAVTAAVLGLAGSTFGQEPKPSLECRDNNRDGRLQRHCEIREQTIAYSGQLMVDGGQNGGVSIKGWSRSDVLVRSKVEASAPSDSEARALVGQIRLNASAGRVSADGPEMVRDRNWSVSYEVFVPRQSNVQLNTHNGGVHVQDVNGRVEFSAVNGGVHLSRVNGHVQGKTTNGGLHIELAGNRWDGDGMDVSTTNGGVHLNLPANYSAHLETSTVNGGLHTGFPMTVSGKIGRQLSTNIGSGGATIRVITTNGGVHIDQI